MCFFRFCFYVSCLQSDQMSTLGAFPPPKKDTPWEWLGLLTCGRHYQHCPKHLAKLGKNLIVFNGQKLRRRVLQDVVRPSFSPKHVRTLEPEVGYSIQNMFVLGSDFISFSWAFGLLISSGVSVFFWQVPNSIAHVHLDLIITFVFLKGWEHVRCDQNPGYLMHMFFKKLIFFTQL